MSEAVLPILIKQIPKTPTHPKLCNEKLIKDFVLLTTDVGKMDVVQVIVLIIYIYFLAITIWFVFYF